MVINEQGLEDATQTLRTVEAHEGFRAIFIMSKKSLLEQGKDVSRALRNRCVDISITFSDKNNKDDNQRLADLRAESVDGRNLGWSLAQLQTKFDLLPCALGDLESGNDIDQETARVDV